MARPRVFISSTYYDLKHLRSSIENFVESFGFEAVLSEKGRIAYAPDIPLDESCYREVSSADILVLIIGGRYGSEVSAERKDLVKTFYDRYSSVTRGEYRAAVERDVPTYILVERAIYAEYETYLRNKGNTAVVYAHVDSVNVFALVEEILSQPRNNPVQQFDRYSDIENWLREQWAGLFRDLLQRVRTQTEISNLQAQVVQLSELNKTLKNYLEAIVMRLAPNDSVALIQAETDRLNEASIRAAIESNSLASYFIDHFDVQAEQIGQAVMAADSARDFFRQLAIASGEPDFNAWATNADEADTHLWRDIDDLRLIITGEPFPNTIGSVRGTTKKRRTKQSAT